jgi:hypothetical protein
MTKVMECRERYKMGIDWRQAAQDRDGWGRPARKVIILLG